LVSHLLGVFGVGRPLKASSSSFMCKKCLSILRHLLVSSVLGGFPGHLHDSSHPFTSFHLASSLGIFGVGHPLRASPSSFMCQKCHTVSRRLFVSLALGGFPDHLYVQKLSPSSLGVLGTGWPPRASSCSLHANHLLPSFIILSWCPWH